MEGASIRDGLLRIEGRLFDTRRLLENYSYFWRQSILMNEKQYRNMAADYAGDALSLRR